MIQTAEQLLTTITNSQSVVSPLSMKAAAAFVAEHGGHTGAYLHRLLAAAVRQHEGTEVAAAWIIDDFRYVQSQLELAIAALEKGETRPSGQLGPRLGRC